MGSALVLMKVARTPARETLVDLSCVDLSCLESSPGDMDVLRLDSPESTPRHLTSSAGSTATCNREIWLMFIYRLSINNFVFNQLYKAYNQILLNLTVLSKLY